MNISVVMATYNGEKYILEQLESIKNQTMMPDEVIICDDGSNDHTIQIIEKFIYENHLKTWFLFQNEKNLNVINNFLKCADMAAGRILFFSDQDDVWDKEKINHMYQAMRAKKALAVCCLSSTINSEGKTIENKIAKWSRIPERQHIQKISLCEKLKYAKSAGLCLAFKKEILPEIKQMVITYGLPHDIPVGTVASIKGGYYILNEELVEHRVHGKNLSSAETRLSCSVCQLNRQISSRQMKLKELQAVHSMYGDILSEKDKMTLDEAIKTTEMLIKCLQEKKIGGVVKAIFMRNEMMNRKLAVRNLLAVIYNRCAVRK